MTDPKPSSTNRERTLQHEIQTVERTLADKIATLQADAERNRRLTVREATEHAGRNKRAADAERAKILAGRDKARKNADQARTAAVAKAESDHKAAHREADRIAAEARDAINDAEAKANRPLHAAIAEAEAEIKRQLALAIEVETAAAKKALAPLQAELVKIKKMMAPAAPAPAA